MNDYETTLIFDPQLQDEGFEQAVQKYSAVISGKGTINRTEKWGLKRLAYEIRKQSQGYYVHFIHNSPPDIPRELERQCKLDESCLRYLTIVSDNPRYMEERDKRTQAREAANQSSVTNKRDEDSDSDDESDDSDSDDNS